MSQRVSNSITLPRAAKTTRILASVLWTATVHPHMVTAESVQDVVRLAPLNADATPRVVRGEVIEWTGDEIVIRRQNGSIVANDARRVELVETSWPAALEEGRGLIAQRDYRAATEKLLAGIAEERRNWVRRVLLYELMLAYEAQHELEKAGDTFLAIVDSDPTTNAYRDAPLAWFPDTAVGRSHAQGWLSRTNSVAAQLLGASHLLATSHRQAALRALSQLLKHDDPRVVALAEAQLWRQQLSQVKRTDARRWAQRIERMPKELRAGPYFVLANAWQRLGNHDQAVLAYLRIPILFPSRRLLADRSLISAAQLSLAANHADEATRLLQQALAEYADDSTRAQAQQLLDDIERRAE